MSRHRRKIMRYEHRSQPLLAHHMFMRRVLEHLGIAAAFVFTSLVLGVLGYHYLVAGLPWIDALLNASMILGGMGPVTPLASDLGKLFASFYPLYSGIAFLATSAVLLAPFAHRVLHRLHLEDYEPEGGSS